MTDKKENVNGSKKSQEVLQYAKVPPQATEIEVAVLGAILLDNRAYDKASEILRPESFYTTAHQFIFKAAKNLAGKNMPIDMMTVVEELKVMGKLDAVGGAYALTKLTNAVFSSANIEAHAKIIHEKYISREIIKLTGEIHNAAFEEETDVFDILGYAEKAIGEIGVNNISSGMSSISKVIEDALMKIEEWRLNDDTVTGIPTGFPALDKATRGWQPGDLIIVAARPSVGKTAFALNIIRNAATNKKKQCTVAVWSLEMKAVYLALRMMSAESEIMLYRLQTGKISDAEMKHLVHTSVNILSKLNIFFSENDKVTLASVARKARRLKQTDNLGLIVIDYLQLMSGEEKSGSREQEIAKISRGLKNLAQELEVPIIALSQLSRDGVKTVTWENGPQISSIRESGAVEQDADLIMMLWGPSDEEINNNADLEGKRKVRIGKQRNGVLITEELEFKSEIQLFKTIQDIPGFKPVSDFSGDNPF